MQHLDPLPTYSICELFQLLGTIVVPSCGNRLAYETFPCETFDILSFLEFHSSDTITIRGKISVIVGSFEPRLAKRPRFQVDELNVERFEGIAEA